MHLLRASWPIRLKWEEILEIYDHPLIPFDEITKSNCKIEFKWYELKARQAIKMHKNHEQTMCLPRPKNVEKPSVIEKTVCIGYVPEKRKLPGTFGETVFDEKDYWLILSTSEAIKRYDCYFYPKRFVFFIFKKYL